MALKHLTRPSGFDLLRLPRLSVTEVGGRQRKITVGRAGK